MTSRRWPNWASRPRTCESSKFPRGTDGAKRLLDDFLTRIDRYDRTRDFPAIKGPSYLGVHLRFGTVSIRELVSRAHALARAGSEARPPGSAS